MSAFEDDVEPAEDTQSRSGTPFGGVGGRGKQNEKKAAAVGLLGKHTRELSPEPDEEFETTDGKSSMWLVKVPRFLLEGWTKVDEDDRKLGTVRVYDPDHRGKQRMELLLPPHPEPAIPLPPSHPYLQTDIPRKYEMRMTSEQGSTRVRNLYAFKERVEGGDEEDDDDFSDDDDDIPTKGKGKFEEGTSSKSRRVVKMVGTVTMEAALKPQMSTTISMNGNLASPSGITPEYREVLRKRRIEASKPKHAVKILDESDISRRNMMTSGVGQGFTSRQNKTSLIPSKTNVKKDQNEKFARMPRNELLDMLFELFEEYPYWSIKGLRSKVQQPEVYLREVLMSVADYHRVGPYASLWSLKAEYQAMRKRGELGSNAAASGSKSNGDDNNKDDGSSPQEGDLTP
ncbi:hypothetical protein CBS101457_002534 [Exobasidium rhododendri]|nr:hypothetical protein CBS101457_002534 [Exobasidium rhododendri]